MSDDPEDLNNELENLSEEDFECVLADAIQEWTDENDAPPTRTLNYEDAGVLTRNKGLIVFIGNAEFQITIVKRH